MNVSARLSPAAIPPNPAPRYGRPTDDDEQEAALTGTLDESSTINREGAPAKVFRTEMNPVDLLARAASVYAEKSAVVHGDRRYTYAEFGERAWRLANGLRAAGLERGDRVATLLPNCPAMLEAHFGVPAAGGILVTVNTRLSSAEVEYILRHSGAGVLLSRRGARRARRAARPLRHRRDPGRRHRRPRRPLRGSPRSVFARAAGELARGRGGDDLDQLHVWHDRSAEGRACTRIAAHT